MSKKQFNYMRNIQVLSKKILSIILSISIDLRFHFHQSNSTPFLINNDTKRKSAIILSET